MFEVIEKQNDSIIVKMDTRTFEWIQDEIEEDISQYEFIFDKPVLASTLLKK